MLLGGIVVAFFLSFVTVSCEGDALGTFSGIQLVPGTRFLLEGRPERMDPELFAILALGAAIVGLSVTLRRSGMPRFGTSVAAVGALSLLLLMWRVAAEVARAGEGMLSVGWELEYWIALIHVWRLP